MKTRFLALAHFGRDLYRKHQDALLVAGRVGVSATLAYLVAVALHQPETYWPVLSAVIVARGGAKKDTSIARIFPNHGRARVLSPTGRPRTWPHAGRQARAPQRSAPDIVGPDEIVSISCPDYTTARSVGDKVMQALPVIPG